jgi:L-ascorbate 6-phosphate lactonase
MPTAVAEHGVELCWLGQSTFELRFPGANLIVDPFLSPHPDRLVPPPQRKFSDLDGVLITHEHWDHLDVDACRRLAADSPSASFVAPEPILDQLGISDERVTGLQPGGSVRVGEATVHAVPACHALHVEDGYSVDPRFLGYVVDAGGTRVYHAGDTIDFDGLAARLRELQVEIALLPINGRRPEREAQDIAGNLEPEDAIELAAAAGARIAIPMHHDMFAANLGDPARFVAYATKNHPELAVVLPARFAPLKLSFPRPETRDPRPAR